MGTSGWSTTRTFGDHVWGFLVFMTVGRQREISLVFGGTLTFD